MKSGDIERRQRLGSFLHEKLGLSIDSYAEYCVNRLLDELPFDFDDGDEETMRRVIGSCSIGETTFLRHPEQFRLIERLLPFSPAVAEGRPIRAWSAGCATGEEAYSLSATLQSLGRPYQVVGTDINEDFLLRARESIYRLWSLRGVTDLSKAPWLKIIGLDVTVCEKVRRPVSFHRLNLQSDPYEGPFDLIFCRNVLLYFQPDAARDVIHRMARHLQPGGVLVLGYTDPSPDPACDLVPENSNGVRYYQKPFQGELVNVGQGKALVPGHAGDPQYAAWEVSPESVSEKPVAAVPVGAEHTEHVANMDAASDLEQKLRTARGLTMQMCFDDALGILEGLYRDYPLEIEPCILLTMVAEEANHLDLALAAARRACFLDPRIPMAQYLLGCCLWRKGQREQARRRFHASRLSLVQIEPLDQPLEHGQGLTGQQLERILYGYIN